MHPACASNSDPAIAPAFAPARGLGSCRLLHAMSAACQSKHMYGHLDASSVSPASAAEDGTAHVRNPASACLLLLAVKQTHDAAETRSESWLPVAPNRQVLAREPLLCCCWFKVG
jgi:hypothetical protein